MALSRRPATFGLFALKSHLLLAPTVLASLTPFWRRRPTIPQYEPQAPTRSPASKHCSDKYNAPIPIGKMPRCIRFEVNPNRKRRPEGRRFHSSYMKAY